MTKTHTRKLIKASDVKVGDRLPGAHGGFVVEDFEPYTGILGTGRVAIDHLGNGYTLLDDDTACIWEFVS